MAGVPDVAWVRGLHTAAMLLLLGTLAFAAWIRPAAQAADVRLDRLIRRLGVTCGLVSIVLGAAWLMISAAAMAGAESLTEALHVLPVVAGATWFGHLLTLRLGLLAVATLLAACAGDRRGIRLMALLAAGATAALQGLIGHAGATPGPEGSTLVVSEALHLLAAGLWIGALPPMWLAVRRLSPLDAALLCERFSPLGLGCVLVLAGTGFAQALQLIGNLPRLLGTPYGQAALLKITLFAVALALAIVNRLWLTDRLSGNVAPARRLLLASVGIEALTGLCILLAASVLASLQPAMHTAPVWPLAWRLDPSAWQMPGVQQTAIPPLLTAAGALLLAVASVRVRSLRLAAGAALVLALLWSGWRLSPLVVPAFPTTFQTSPTGFAADSIVSGQALFNANCAACHGANGQGDGPAARALRMRPADLTQPHLLAHPPGDLLWWIKQGIQNADGAAAMPAFGDRLSEPDIWHIVDFLRAHAAGIDARRADGYDSPLQVPGLPVSCPGLPAGRLSDLLGSVVHVTTTNANVFVPGENGIATVTLRLTADGGTGGGPECRSSDPAAWDAFAILAGIPPSHLAGTEFLIDPDGWLRAVHWPDDADGWHTPNDLTAAVRAICASPAGPASGAMHEHHH